MDARKHASVSLRWLAGFLTLVNIIPSFATQSNFYKRHSL
jgi:hypothetical protein